MGDERQQSDSQQSDKTENNSTPHRRSDQKTEVQEFVEKNSAARLAERKSERKTRRYGDSDASTDSTGPTGSTGSRRRDRQLKHSEAEVLRGGGPTDSQGLEDISQPAMLVGGGLAAAWGLKRFGKLSGFFLMGIGGGMIYQALSNNDMLGSGFKKRLLQTGASETAHVRSAVTVDLPVEEVYDGWRTPSNFSKAMRHIESARPVEDKSVGNRDVWRFRARIPRTDATLEWDAEVIEDVENQKIVWRSVEGSDVHNEGTVEFHPRTDGTGTEVHVDILYHPPGAKAGRALGKYLRGLTEQVLKEDIRRFKQHLETGVVATIDGQSSGRRTPPSERTSPPAH